MRACELLRHYQEMFAELPDHTHNGMQLEGTKPISRMLLSVSLSEPLIDYAISGGYDAIFVHHGVFGSELFHFEGAKARKFRKLFSSGVSLFAYHLPLDAHAELGHNIVMARAIGLRNIKPFECGFVGENNEHLSCAEIARRAGSVMARPGYALSVSGSGPFVPKTEDGMLIYENCQTPTKVFVCSGGSGSFLEKAIAEKCDLFVLGEISEYIPARAQEVGMSLIVGGHWRTETVGILQMREQLSRLGIAADFVSFDNII